MFTESKVFVFPGQGSQEVGMGQTLLAESPIAEKTFTIADAILAKRGWKGPLRDICLHGTPELLSDVEITLPAVLTTAVAATNELKVRGIVPQAVAGHSLGEYSALVAAGSMTFPDAVALVAERGKLMKQAGETRPGGMAAVLGLPLETVETLCRRIEGQIPGSTVQVANINSDAQIVISGDEEAIASAADFAEELGARRTVVLPVTVAGHSALMEPAAKEMRYVLDSVAIVEPAIPFYSPTTARRVDHPQAIKNLLVAQLTGRVLWAETIRTMIADGYTKFLEVGPGHALTQLIKKIDKSAFAEAANF